MQQIKDALMWRYATKSYDVAKKINNDDLDLIIESVRLAPASFGLQPFNLIHVKSEQIRNELKNASWGQTQITDASDLFVFAVSTNLNEKHVDDFIKQNGEERGITEESLKDYKNMILGSINSKNNTEKINWISKQAYLALGFMLETAAIMNIDATPMEGFDPEQYNKILDLDSQNLTALVVVTLGYRSIDDKYADLKKIRVSREKFVIEK